MCLHIVSPRSLRKKSAHQVLRYLHFHGLGLEAKHRHDLTHPVRTVVEEEEVKVEQEDGTEVTIPVNMANPNPNDFEFDNLYLDMNDDLMLGLGGVDLDDRDPVSDRK